MAQHALTAVTLPAGTELQSFAQVVAHLLTERPSRSFGARVVRRRAGVGLQHLDYRDYQPGDELRHIDWRQTARIGRPILRQFEAESSAQWCVLLDASSSMQTQGGSKWHSAVQAAAAMSYALLACGARVRVLAVAERVVADTRGGLGAAQYTSIARALRELAPPARAARSELGSAAAQLSGSGALFVLSDLLGPRDMHGALRALRERCGEMHVLRVSDARDRAVEGDGVLQLADVESGQRRVVSGGAALQAQATALHAAARERLRNFCTRGAIACSEWDIAIGWRRTLIDHLVAARAP